VRGNNAPHDHQNIRARAIVDVGVQFGASTFDVLIRVYGSIQSSNFASEPNLTVSEVSEVTQRAIAHAVDILPLSSLEVEVLMAARAFVQKSRGTKVVLPESQLMNSAYSHGSTLPSM